MFEEGATEIPADPDDAIPAMDMTESADDVEIFAAAAGGGVIRSACEVELDDTRATVKTVFKITIDTGPVSVMAQSVRGRGVALLRVVDAGVLLELVHRKTAHAALASMARGG